MKSFDQIFTFVMGVTKMGYIVPRVGIEPISLAFHASVLPLHHIGSLMSPLCPRLPVYAVPCLRGQCRLLEYNKLDVTFFPTLNTLVLN